MRQFAQYVSDHVEERCDERIDVADERIVEVAEAAAGDEAWRRRRR